MENIYTVKEAAKILGFSTNTLYKYLENGAIEAARGVGKQARFRIPHSSIEAYLKTTLSENQVQKVLNPGAFAKIELTTPTSPEIPPKNVATHQFPLTVSRFLLMAALVFIILDIVLSPTFSLTTSLLRLGLVAIFVLLAYQYGGYQKLK